MALDPVLNRETGIGHEISLVVGDQRDGFEGWLNKLDWPWVSGHNGVGGEQRDPLRAGLRYQDAIERVFVDGRQTLHKNSVRAGNGQLAVAVVQQAAPQQPCIHLEVSAAQAAVSYT